MQFKTSGELYDEYQKATARDTATQLNNKGLNLINANQLGNLSFFYVGVSKKIELNLLEKEEKFYIDTNLPMCSRSWAYEYQDKPIEYFLNEIDDWATPPRYSPYLTWNRRRDNKVSEYNISRFSTEFINFDNIKFEIGELAEKELTAKGIDIKEEVRKRFAKQRWANEQEEKDFEKYVWLWYRRIDLKNQRNPQERGSYYSEYDKKRDETIRLVITPQEYNKRLKEVETEMNKLKKKYPYLKTPDFNYAKIPKEVEIPSFEEFKEMHKDDVQESWDDELTSDEQQEDYGGDFNNFLQHQYKMWIENNDFIEYEDEGEEEDY